MPGSYRPRPLEVKSCSHCGTSFESRHKRTIYCSSSCRTLAYNSRHRFDRDSSNAYKQVEGELAFSTQNIGVAATGAMVTAVGNYLLNDKPAQKQIMARLVDIEERMSHRLNQVVAASQYQIDFVNAMLQAHPEVQVYINQVRQQRKLALTAKQEKIQALKAKMSRR